MSLYEFFGIKNATTIGRDFCNIIAILNDKSFHKLVWKILMNRVINLWNIYYHYDYLSSSCLLLFLLCCLLRKKRYITTKKHTNHHISWSYYDMLSFILINHSYCEREDSRVHIKSCILMHLHQWIQSTS